MLQRLWNHPRSCPPPCRSGLPAAIQLLYRRGSFDFHIDNAVRDVHGGRERVRTDLSSTLFFSDPEDYDGGELVIQDTYGLQQVKLPAGDLVLYPGTSLHKVNPVTRGARLVLLDPEPGPRRQPAHPAIRNGPVDPATHPRRPRPSLADPPHRYLPQSLRRWSEL